MFRFATLVCIIGLALTAAPALADPAECKALWNSQQPEILGHQNTNKHDFETDHPGLGYSRAYKRPDALLSIFYFDGQAQTIDEETVGSFFRSAIEEMKEAWREKGLEPMKPERLRYKKTHIIYMASSADQTGNLQYVAIWKWENCMVKTRYTMRSNDKTKGRDRFLRLTLHVLQSL